MPGMMICTPMSRTFFFTEIRGAVGLVGIVDDDDDGTVIAFAGPAPDLFVDDNLLLIIPLLDGTVATVVALVVWSVVVVTFPVG